MTQKVASKLIGGWNRIWKGERHDGERVGMFLAHLDRRLPAGGSPGERVALS